MGNLTLAVGGLWSTIIEWMGSFIPSFGLVIILLTVFIKLVLSPLEVWQKITTKKNAEKQAIIQPKLQKLQKQFGNNKELLNKKTMELYKKENYNMMGSCLGMLINLVLTLTIFISLFSSLNTISAHNINKEYSNLQTEYLTVYKQSLVENTEITLTNDMTVADIETQLSNLGYGATELENKKAAAKAAASAETAVLYGEIKEGFLWIKNVYRPDTWNSVFPTSGEYLSISNTNFKKVDEVPYTDIFGVEYTVEAEAKEAFILSFNEVTTDIQKDYSGWNGWLILVILAAGITLLSQIITAMGNKPKKQYDKKGNEIPVQNPANNKFLLILLPILMVVFTIQYSSAFALYIVVNSAMSTLIGFATTLVMNKIEKNKQLKTEENKVIKNTKGV